MKKIIFIVIILINMHPFRSESQDIVEEMKITSILVQVRAFDRNGELVKNLKKDDFNLYENDQKQDIEGFFSDSARINTHTVNILDTREGYSPQKSRFFVLVFRLTEFNQNLAKGIDYLFEKILTPTDDILVFINDQTLFLHTNQDNQPISPKDLLNQTLKEEAQKTKDKLKKTTAYLSQKLNPSRKFVYIEGNITNYVNNLYDYISSYIVHFNSFFEEYLKPDIDKYYNFSKYLEKINKDKYIINFLQLNLIPDLATVEQLEFDLTRLFRAFQTRSYTLDRVIDFSPLTNGLALIKNKLKGIEDFSQNEISKLFYKTRATFYTLLFSTEGHTRQEIEEDKISSGLQSFLNKVTVNSAGAMITSNNLTSTLHKISQKENFYYLLSYTPKEPEKIGKLKITLKNKSYKLVYDDNIRSDYISDYLKNKRVIVPQIKIDQLKYKDKKLSFEIKNFSPDLTNNLKGKIYLRISIKDENNQTVYQKDRLLNAREDHFSISINLPWLEEKKYQFIIEVKDLVSKKTDFSFYQSNPNLKK